jgi:Mrp family chromosome partitioning ATPase
MRQEATVLADMGDLRGAAARLDRPSVALQSAMRAEAPDSETLRAALRDNLGQLDTRIAVDSAQLSLLERAAAQREEAIASQTDSLVRRQQLERQIEIDRQLYDAFLTRLRETAEQDDIQSADSVIVASAVPPAQPSGPRRPLIAVGGGVLGGVLMSGLVLLGELRRKTFFSIGEVERATGLPVLGAIPNGPKSRSPVEFAWRVRRGKNAAFRASVRNLRTAISLRAVDKRAQVVMLTSTRPEEGKTTTTLLLAQATANNERSVLVLDCDFRKSSLRATAKPGQEIEVAALLRQPERLGGLRDAESGVSTLLLKLDGTDPADFFESKAFEEIMALLRRSFDVIYVDTPPVLATTDARLIARFVDFIVYVVRWDGTARSEVALGLRQLLDGDAPVEGVAVTRVDPKSGDGGDVQALAYQIYGDYQTS